MYRKIINEKELEEYLLSHGFEIIEMSKLSFLEQVKICAESKIIVGPHGAGLSNIVFCNNATILELFSPSYVNPCFWQLSKNGNNQYHYLLGEDVSGNGPCELRDFKVNMEDVKKTLNTIFSEHGL
ncbi:MAG: capsular polysaccharide biosynthesis protein [Methanohalophilus sp.]|nr:MAG: capsular polysaccharide biosynthesis protein [Methanohalophilus sp.]